MFKVLRLLGLLLINIVSLPSFGQERDIIYQETFADGLGDFTVDIVKNQYDLEKLWVHNDDGSVCVTNEKAGSYYNCDAWLISPTINLAEVHDAIFNFEYLHEGYTDDFTIYIKENDGEWQRFQNNGAFLKASFTKSQSFYLNRYNGKTIQLAIRYFCNSSVPKYNLLRIRNFRVEAFAGADTNEPKVEVNSISEFLSLPIGTFAKVNLSEAICTGQLAKVWFLKDNSGSTSVNLYTYISQSIYDGTKINGVMTGIRSSEFGYNEISDVRFEGEFVNDDMMMHSSSTPYTEINQGDLLDYDCEKVQVILDPGMTIYDAEGFIEGKSFTNYDFTHPVEAQGYAYMTPEGTKRVLVAGSLAALFLDTEAYFYDTSIDILYKKIMRSLKSGQWNTLILPFDLNTGNVSILGFSNAQFAHFKYVLNGIMYFETKTLSKQSINAGTPFLVKPQYNMSWVGVSNTPKVVFQNVGMTGSSGSVGDYLMKGTLCPTQPEDGSYYFTSGNTIRPLASGGTINAYRAYFEPATPNAAQARAISIDGVVTAIDDIEIDGITNAPMYNLNGQRVNDSSRKGLYIQNGKKVVK